MMFVTIELALKNSILSNYQYGFRSTRLTSMALLDFMEKLGSAIDSKHITLGVFIDLKKAFDNLISFVVNKETYSLWSERYSK